MGRAQHLQSKIQVLVAGNGPLHAQLIAEVIRKDRHINVIDAVFCADSVLRTAMDRRPDILLISANLEEQTKRGLDVLVELLAQGCHLKAVVLLDSPTPNHVVHAFLSGARGVFYRNASLKALCKCIRVVHEGQIWANNDELGFLLAALAAARPALRSFPTDGMRLLSERELAVVRCLAGSGLSNKEIALQLGISDHTVKNYMLRIFDKLGVSSRVELIFYVLSRTNLIQANAVEVGTEEVARAPVALELKEFSKYPRHPMQDAKTHPTISHRLGSA